VSDEILVERRDRIATVVFNRPHVRNAFNLAMWSALPGIVDGLARDPEVRAIVFRGAGEEAFASGADISEFRENRKDRASAETYNARTAAAAHAMETCPKPTVAMRSRRSTRISSLTRYPPAARSVRSTRPLFAILRSR